MGTEIKFGVLLMGVLTWAVSTTWIVIIIIITKGSGNDSVLPMPIPHPPPNYLGNIFTVNIL